MTLYAREEAFRSGATTSHWPHEWQQVDVNGLPQSFTLIPEARDLVFPEKQKEKDDSRFPKPGPPSILPVKRYRTTMGSIPMRSAATDEWGETVGHLMLNDEVSGYTFSGWLRLRTWPKDAIDSITPEVWAKFRGFASLER